MVMWGIYLMLSRDITDFVLIDISYLTGFDTRTGFKYDVSGESLPSICRRTPPKANHATSPLPTSVII